MHGPAQLATHEKSALRELARHLIGAPRLAALDPDPVPFGRATDPLPNMQRLIQQQMSHCTADTHHSISHPVSMSERFLKWIYP